jgi:hypothetical protein
LEFKLDRGSALALEGQAAARALHRIAMNIAPLMPYFFLGLLFGLLLLALWKIGLTSDLVSGVHA